MDEQVDNKMMDEMIRNLPQMIPSPGFDAAFWSKIAQVESKHRRFLWLKRFVYDRPLTSGIGVTAVLMVALFIFLSSYSDPTEEEVFIADHMEMLKEFELIERLDLLENWEAIQTIKEHG
jgi:hypothetical protein